MCCSVDGEQEKASKTRNILESFCIFGWWMKGRISALLCLGYKVMHVTLGGNSSKDLKGN